MGTTTPAARMLRATEVAARLDFATKTIRDHARSGLIPAVRIGGQWRSPADAIEQLATDVSGRDSRSADAPPSAEESRGATRSLPPTEETT